MIRPWQVWLVFAACVLGAAGAMVWLTREAMNADRQRRAAQADAALGQRVSLALWRMDTELVPIIAQEVIRPPSAYFPAAKVVAELPQYVLLQFQVGPNDVWQSPQSPLNHPLTPRLTELSKAVEYGPLAAELPSTPLPSTTEIARGQNSINSRGQGEEFGANLNEYQFFEGNRANFAANAPAQSAQPNQALCSASGAATGVRCAEWTGNKPGSRLSTTQPQVSKCDATELAESGAGPKGRQRDCSCCEVIWKGHSADAAGAGRREPAGVGR